jgi:carotenoid 1,2-hydratase
MPESPGVNSRSSASFISSIRDDVWHGRSDRHSFERWHFDALSDDGREALIIAFYDNYPFSPRNFGRRHVASANVNSGQFPAVTFLYSVDGEIVMQAVNEWSFDRFSARMDDITCTIGDSSFRVERAKYGSGYIVHIDAMTARKKRIEADLEWLSIETDLMPGGPGAETPAMVWNIVAPRSDVSGRIVQTGIRGKIRKAVNFRGTGYHDHFRSSTSLQEAIASRCWGRAHFSDLTAVFQHISYEGTRGDASRIALVQDGAITAHDAEFRVTGDRIDDRNTEAEFVSASGCRITVRQASPLQRGFFEQRMLSEVTLELPDGCRRHTDGIVELCNPKGMYNPLYRWMSDLKIGRNGGSPFF